MTIQEWLGKDNELGISIWERKYRNGNETFDEWTERVSGGNKSVAELIRQKKFLFGGRILANRGLNQENKKVTYSNCFSGDTKIWTKNGLKTLAELEGQTVKVFTRNAGWEDASIQCFGNQPVKKLILNRGKMQHEILVTGDHIWFVENDKHLSREIKTDDLQPGMKLMSSSSKCYRTYKPSPFGIAHGFFTGDGDHGTSNNSLRVNICKGKEEMLQYYMPDTIGHSGEVTTICGMPRFFLEKPPLSESPSYLYGWLAGYFAADGSVDDRGACVFTSCNKSNLEYVQDVMCVLGIPPYFITEQTRISNLTNRESTIYKLAIPSAYLNESFFILTKHREKFNSSARKPNRWTVQEVSDVVDTIPVYCAVEPKTQSFTIEGNIITHNCYVISAPEDNLESIFDCAKNLARTYSYGGGCGIDISKLAPSGAVVRNAAKTSSGAVSFMDLYSMVTGLISQFSRRGALMISMACNHPDIESFIDIKTDLTRVTKANTSIRVLDDFMKAVRDNSDYILSFTRRETGEKIQKVVKARELFKKMAFNNWDMGEPGMLFWDRISGWNLLSGFSDFHYGGVNPCAEEPLPNGGSCLLGSLNLSAFVHKNDKGNPYFDFEELADAVYSAVVGLNEVLDEGLPLHPLQEQRDSVRDWRQIGLGVMGIADMLIKMEIEYGSEDSIELCKTIAHSILNHALYTSCNLAAFFDPFPKYDYESLCNSTFYQENVTDENKKIIEEYGLRNSQLLTIAPTGTLSTMLGISGGIEPIFANYYTRKTESLYNEDKYYKVYTPIVQAYMKEHNLNDDADLPSYFVTANDIDYKDRIKFQAAWQQYIDASISSTINLPEKTTVEDVMRIYYEAWRAGLKGITVFRNNCRRAGILTTEPKKEEPKEKTRTITEEELESRPIIFDSVTPISRKTFGTTHGNTYCRNCACGTLYITVNCDDEGNVVETFVESSKGGICKANIAAVNRLISLNLRAGVKVEEIIDQLKGIDCPACSKTNKAIDGLSCPDIIGRALRTFYYGEEEEANKKLVQSKKATQIKSVEQSESSDDKCPDCGAPIRREGGCVICVECGWSKCG